jgi:hypothetical protein
MSEGRDWEVEGTPRNFKFFIDDCRYFVCDEGLAAISHAILLLQDTFRNESQRDRESQQEIYEDSQNRFAKVNEKREILEKAINEMMAKKEWEDARKSIPVINLFVKLEDGSEYRCIYERGKFMSAIGVEYANVRSWRYADAN